jgi:hypothetical protein
VIVTSVRFVQPENASLLVLRFELSILTVVRSKQFENALACILLIPLPRVRDVIPVFWNALLLIEILVLDGNSMYLRFVQSLNASVDTSDAEKLGPGVIL